MFTVSGSDRLGSRAARIQLTDVNPQVRGFSLGEQEEISWTAKDGRTVGGVLVKSVSEMAWMDYYVRGQGAKFSWRAVLDTLADEGEGARKSSPAAGVEKK